MKNMLKHGIQIVVVMVLMFLLMLGSTAPFGQDEPHGQPQPTPTARP